MFHDIIFTFYPFHWTFNLQGGFFVIKSKCWWELGQILTQKSYFYADSVRSLLYILTWFHFNPCSSWGFLHNAWFEFESYIYVRLHSWSRSSISYITDPGPNNRNWRVKFTSFFSWRFRVLKISVYFYIRL